MSARFRREWGRNLLLEMGSFVKKAVLGPETRQAGPAWRGVATTSRQNEEILTFNIDAKPSAPPQFSAACYI